MVIIDILLRYWKLEKPIELNSLEKQNGRNGSEDKLRQQENYGEIEELFNPFSKTLNTSGEAWLAHNKQRKLFKRKF